MIYVLSIGDTIKYGVLDILRSIGIGIINMIYSTIDVLYDVAYKINGLNFIKMLENLENSPFTKIFNAFFILAFAILFLFSVWKITFKVLEADTQDQPIFEIIKEIVKCGFLIFCVYFIFNIGINLGIGFSNAIYNNFSSKESSIGTTMKTAYLTVSEECIPIDTSDKSNKTDKANVELLKEQLKGYASLSGVKTMKELEPLIRNGKLTATKIIDSGAFPLRCEIYVAGLFNDKEAYIFDYNWLFGILLGAVFLFAIAFAVLMLGRRQLELAFLMVISPLVFASSVGRKEQRSALYQQLASLVLQAGALMLLIGLTSIMFNVIQNSTELNDLPYFTKLVAQSILYLGCAMMLLTGSTSINRFIGENVSANSGRDMLMALSGVGNGMGAAAGIGIGSAGASKGIVKGTMASGKGLSQLSKGAMQTATGFKNGLASVNPNWNKKLGEKMENKMGKGLANVMRGNQLKESKNHFARSYGRYLSSSGEKLANNLSNKWDFNNKKYNNEHMKNGVNLAREGISNIKAGFGSSYNSIKNIGNPKRASAMPRVYSNDNDKI